MEGVSLDLKNGIAQVLEQDRTVRFSWRRPEELLNLGNSLTHLFEKHVEDARALRTHADELEASNRYKSEFLANVSHELRTPLNSILLLPLVLNEQSTREETGSSVATKAQMKTADDVDAIPEARYTGKRILVVDDDLRNLLALTPLLNRWEVEVLATGNGQEALDALHDEESFDLVLMDLMMPEMDGYETIRTIRADAALEKLPVIVLTARAADEDRTKALAVGANDYLSKPVEAGDLKLILDQYLQSGNRHSRTRGKQERL